MIWEVLVEGSSKTRGVSIIFCAKYRQFSMGPMCHPMATFEVHNPGMGTPYAYCSSCKEIFNSTELLEQLAASKLAVSWPAPDPWKAELAWKKHIISEWVEYWTGIPESNIEVDCDL